ncbi:uncharacterized protein [Amphiura filiformis]|uniref:uncharacterized protein n=1 Tax=Amphiura filiformis TaxID=82378 RepID=UPI003B20F113
MSSTTGNNLDYPTFSDPPQVSSEPRNLTVTQVTASSVTVEWTRPLSPNGVLKYYQITYTEQKDDANDTLTQKTLINHKDFDNLKRKSSSSSLTSIQAKWAVTAGGVVVIIIAIIIVLLVILYKVRRQRSAPDISMLHITGTTMADNEDLSALHDAEVLPPPSNVPKIQTSPLTATTLQVSDLEFHKQLGRGSYGIVYRVTFKKPFLDLVEAAAKRIAEDDLKEESEVMKDLDHPNIVKLHGVLDDRMGTKILLLEYAPNGTVSDYLTQHQGSQITVRLLKKWARESALALQYLHKRRILHRDLKVSNALLFDDVLKLSDFGLAREMVDSETTSTAKGTWRYMAPEIHTDDHFSFKSDIYAYGLMVLEIGSGKAPFENLDMMHVVYKVATENIKPNIPPDFPEALGDLISRCWNADPKCRPSLEEALEVIDGIADEPTTCQKQDTVTDLQMVPLQGIR